MKPIVDPQIPIVIDDIDESRMGISHPSMFVSEFVVGGVMSSFESMSATLSPNHWSLHGGSGPNTIIDNCSVYGTHRLNFHHRIKFPMNYPN